MSVGYKPVGIYTGFLGLEDAKHCRDLKFAIDASLVHTFGIIRADFLSTTEFRVKGEWRHLHLNGMDEGADGSAYAVSIPISKALSYMGDCVLAYEMNGETLPRDHGYPIRSVFGLVSFGVQVEYFRPYLPSNF